MDYPKLTLKQGEEEDRKGRTFTVHLVASMAVPKLVPPPGTGSVTRPVLLAYAGTPSSVGAFTANLRSGVHAATNSSRFELLRSLGYRFELAAPSPGRSLAIAYLPQLFHLRPGADDESSIRFVSAPPRWWLDRQEELLAPQLGSEARDHARAMAFVARLDARSPLPIANDPRFHHGLYGRALGEGWMATPEKPGLLRAEGLEHLGLEDPVLCDVGHDELAEFLAAATADLLPRCLGPAPTTAPRAAVAGQLALGFDAL